VNGGFRENAQPTLRSSVETISRQIANNTRLVIKLRHEIAIVSE
jgi:hypothetical protein